MTKEDIWVRSCLGKKRYSSCNLAESLVKRIKKERNVDLYVYNCSTCMGFHLTKLKKAPKEFSETRV